MKRDNGIVVCEGDEATGQFEALSEHVVLAADPHDDSISHLTEFEEKLLRLKQCLSVTADQAVAAALGMTKAAFSDRKKRDAFPEGRLYALAAKRPDLQLNVDYILYGTGMRLADDDASMIKDRLRTERERLGFTQEGLADALRISRKTVMRYEQGQSPPSSRCLLGLSRFGADVRYIVTGHRSGDAFCTLRLTSEQRTFVAAAIMSWMDWLAEELTREQSPADAEARERQERARQGLSELPRVLEQLWPDLNVRALLGSRAQ